MLRFYYSLPGRLIYSFRIICFAFARRAPGSLYIICHREWKCHYAVLFLRLSTSAGCATSPQNGLRRTLLEKNKYGVRDYPRRLGKKGIFVGPLQTGISVKRRISIWLIFYFVALIFLNGDYLYYVCRH